MQYEFLFQKDLKLVEVRASGVATLEGFKNLDTELVNHPCWVPGMRVLFDLRKLTLEKLTSEDIRANADFVRGLSDSFGSALFACVMNADVDFGMARMFEILTSQATKLKIRVFRSISEARSWLET